MVTLINNIILYRISPASNASNGLRLGFFQLFEVCISHHYPNKNNFRMLPCLMKANPFFHLINIHMFIFVHHGTMSIFVYVAPHRSFYDGQGFAPCMVSAIPLRIGLTLPTLRIGRHTPTPLCYVYLFRHRH